MKRLNLAKVNPITTPFAPHIINDERVYDDVYVETGTYTIHVVCVNNPNSISAAVIKTLIMLESYNDGYVKKLNGSLEGLHHVFAILNTTAKYIGGMTLEIKCDIASIMYNKYMHIPVINDCFFAGNVAPMVPDFRHYFEVKMHDCILKEYENNAHVISLKEQIEPYRKTILRELRSLT